MSWHRPAVLAHEQGEPDRRRPQSPAADPHPAAEIGQNFGSSDPTLAVAANVAGVAMAVVAAVPGFIDWALEIPGGIPAKRTGWLHMLFNVGALILFAVTLAVDAGQVTSSDPER